MLRHIWNLFAKSGSIWVARVKVNLLKKKEFLECRHSSELFLELEENSEAEGYCQTFLEV